ncbi:WhiB family transcriptional regulator [Streptomyces canus]|uniref:WhiB family transcriptional regulator n=1 Tax=Streptomyces canus TaxID=58343 RepID=UPI002788238C|nr:WhiB family transcriptional regulator [Streptomyces canus]MDQ0762061.1 WhiB family redox-sensing transcriptional regulator [Streptomyces canus]
MPRPSRYAPDTLSRAPHWSDRAACRELDDRSIFFPEDFPKGLVLLVTREAKAVCAGCPVIEACLEAALERPEPNGVWGGLDKDERKTFRRRQQRRARRRDDRRREEGGDGAGEAADAA